MTPSMQYQPPIEPGREVRIHGLVKRQDLNDLFGTVLPQGLNKSTGRVAVRVRHVSVDCGKRTENVMVKRDNVTVLWKTPDNAEHRGEEAEECPICFDTKMNTAAGNNQNASIQTCCGKKVCLKCMVKIMVGPDPDTCPLCRADTSDTSDAKRLQDLTRRAERGDPTAQYNLGCYYDYGKLGLQQDQVKARELYKLAADQDHARAAANLGCCYRDGEGGPRNYREAARYFERAANLGHVESQTNLGIMYLYGHLPFDLSKGRHWLQKGANAGDELAISELAKIQ